MLLQYIPLSSSSPCPPKTPIVSRTLKLPFAEALSRKRPTWHTFLYLGVCLFMVYSNTPIQITGLGIPIFHLLAYLPYLQITAKKHKAGLSPDWALEHRHFWGQYRSVDDSLILQIHVSLQEQWKSQEIQNKAWYYSAILLLLPLPA